MAYMRTIRFYDGLGKYPGENADEKKYDYRYTGAHVSDLKTVLKNKKFWAFYA